MVEIKIHKFKDMDLRGATIISGFPTAGLVSTIAAHYLISSLELDQIGAIDSHDFPPVSMVYAGKPKFPARIYADEKIKLVIFLSEFTPPPFLARPVADMMLDWAKKNLCARILAPEVYITENPVDVSAVYGVGSTDRARAKLKELDIQHLGRGMISGVSGVLLNQSRLNGFDTIILLAEASHVTPFAKSAAKIIEVIHRIHPPVKIDVEPLYKEAEKTEKIITRLRDQIKYLTKPEPEPDMYR